MQAIVAIVSDLHVNSTVALCPPTVTLDDGGTYKASKAQRWIWRQWLDYWDNVRALQAGRPLYVILNGELADDLNHRSTQLVTKNPSDMMRMAVAALTPMLDLAPDGIFVTRGTEAHAGPSGHLDEKIADDIGAIGPQHEATASWRELRAEFGGVPMSVQHHPEVGIGTREWTRTAARLASHIWMIYVDKYIRREVEAVPAVAYRAHLHTPASASYNGTEVVLTPAWQLRTAFAHRIGAGVMPVGGDVLIAEDGQYTRRELHYRWPMRQMEPMWRQS